MTDESFFEKIMKKLNEISSRKEPPTEKEKDFLMRLYSAICKSNCISEKSGWRVNWVVEKFKDNLATSPYEVVNAGQNVILNSGANLILRLICGQSNESFNAGHARIIVGNDSTPESPTQTGVLGKSSSANMARGCPAISGNKAVFQAAFGQNQANFEWNEICISSKNTAMNRKVLTGFGTKPSTEIWVVQASVEIVNA